MEHSGVYNTEHIDQVLKILSKSIKKKYPFIEKMLVDVISGPLVFINIVIDFNEFLETNNLLIRSDVWSILQNHPKYSDKYINNVKYSFLNILLQNDEVFGFTYNREIEGLIEEMVDYLPEQIIPKVEWESSMSDSKMIDNASFRITDFIFKFDVNRYFKYVNGK